MPARGTRASKKAQVELRESIVNAISGIDSAQEWLVEPGARDQSQIKLLMSQVAGLKAAMAIQEVECSTANATREEAEQDRR